MQKAPSIPSIPSAWEGRDSIQDHTAYSSKNDAVGFWRTLIRGEYGLAKTYWLYGVAVGALSFLVMFAIAIVTPDLFKATWFRVGSILVFSAYQMPVLTGTWNAATKYTGPRIWAIFAKVLVVLGILGTGQNFASLAYLQSPPPPAVTQIPQADVSATSPAQSGNQTTLQSTSVSATPNAQPGPQQDKREFKNTDEIISYAIATYRNSGVTGMEIASKSCWNRERYLGLCIFFDVAANRIILQYSEAPSAYFSHDSFFGRATAVFKDAGVNMAATNALLSDVDKATSKKLSQE